VSPAKFLEVTAASQSETAVANEQASVAWAYYVYNKHWTYATLFTLTSWI